MNNCNQCLIEQLYGHVVICKECKQKEPKKENGEHTIGDTHKHRKLLRRPIQRDQ